MTTTGQQQSSAEGNGAMAPFQQRFNSFRGTLTKMEKQLAMALPKHIKPERLTRIILTEMTKTPKLLDCTDASLFGAILQAAQLGLEPGGVLGQSYLVPYFNNKVRRLECQLIPGYKGLVKLAYQSGEVGAIRARVVREKDEFNYEYGMREVLIHKPHRGSDAGGLVAVYAVAKIKGIDEEQFLVLERWEIDAIRDRSKSSSSGPWVTDFDEMAKKSALRRLCKLLPASVENDALARAVAIDERVEAGLDQEFESIIDVTATPVSDEKPEDDQSPSSTAKPADSLDRLAAEKKAQKEKADQAAGSAKATEKPKKQMTIIVEGANAGPVPPIPLSEMSEKERAEWDAQQAKAEPGSEG